jgi:hypothetical protein
MLANKHIVAINQLMLNTTAEYINCFAKDETDIEQFKMYTSDIAHNIAALDVFNSTLNAEVLHDNIMRQDTLVREFYIAVLLYIENNKLIPANMFCCN